MVSFCSRASFIGLVSKIMCCVFCEFNYVSKLCLTLCSNMFQPHFVFDYVLTIHCVRQQRFNQTLCLTLWSTMIENSVWFDYDSTMFTTKPENCV